MVDNIVYGAGGIPMVKQPNEVKPVEKTAEVPMVKKKRRNLFKKSMVKVKKTTLMDLTKNMEMTNEDIFRICIK